MEYAVTKFFFSEQKLLFHWHQKMKKKYLKNKKNKNKKIKIKIKKYELSRRYLSDIQDGECAIPK